MHFIQKIDGNRVVFVDGSSVEADHLILCTGYKMDLPYLPAEMKEEVINEDNNDLKVCDVALVHLSGMGGIALFPPDKVNCICIQTAVNLLHI